MISPTPGINHSTTSLPSMKLNKKIPFIPMLVIALGFAWLLNVLNVLPGVNWLWTGGLGACGALILIAAGLNQLTIVAGPFLMVASVLSLLRQTGKISVNVEFPILFIAFGIFLLLSYVLPLQMPKYLQTREPSDEQK
jgi:hypothetical protein